MPGDLPVYEQIELYLCGEMDAEQRAAFEAALAGDPQLQQQLENYRRLQQEYADMARSKTGENELSVTLGSLNEKYFVQAAAPPKSKPAPVRRMMFIAAAAAAVAVAFFLVKPALFNRGSHSAGELFADFYEHEPLGIDRGAADSVTRATQFFDKQAYAEALAILEPYTNVHNKDNDNLLLARGVCYLFTEKYAQADSLFSVVLNGGSNYRQRAQWLSALLMLKQNNKAACRERLQRILPDSDFYTPAQKLLGEL